MHKFLSLTRVTLKNTMGMVSDGKSKHRNAALIYIILFLSLLPLAGLLFMMFQNTFEMFDQFDQSGSVLAVAFHLSSFITFFFSIFLIPSVFYFSKDGETLLSLPIKPEAILGSKFVVCLLYEYVFVIFILIPAFAAYVTTCDIQALSLLFSIVIFVLMPIYPLVLSSIISMLIMRFVPFFKNRDRFNLIAGILSVVVALGFSFTFNKFTMTQDPTTLISTLMSGNNSLITMLGYFFPGVPFAAHAFVDADVLSFLIFIIITIASLIVCLLLGKVLYFKGLIGFSETSSSRKKLSTKELGKLNTRRNRLLTYTGKELKLLIRTPIFLMNCIGSSIIFPILMFILPMFEGDALSFTQIPKEFTDLLPTFWPYFLFGGIILGIFVGNLNLISSTAISREGTNVAFMKYIPMPLQEQLHAKVLSGILVSIFTDILMMAALYIIIPIFPLSMLIIAFASSLPAIIFSNYIGIYIDIKHPKLVWEQEVAAVKQNVSGFVAMMGGMAVAALVGVLAFYIPHAYISFASIGILLLICLASVVLYKGIGKFAKHAFDAY